MKIYINTSLDPQFNLACEEYLLEHSREDVFMLWRNSPAVIIGKNQNAFAEVDFDFLRENDVKLVRRLTGGGAVFHDLGNVNYTFITSDNPDGIDFARFTEPIIRVLEGFGIRARLSGRNDLVADTPEGERKFSGSAQCRCSCADGRVRTLHHGTLLWSSDLSSLVGALRVKPEKLKSKGIRSVSSRVVNLCELASERLSAELLIERIAAYAEARFGGEAERFDASLDAGILELVRTKYAADEWNLGRMGNFTVEGRRRFPYGEVGLSLRVERGVIVEARFDGDFFGELEPSTLETRLCGVRFERPALEAALAGSERYIAGSTPEALAGLIFEKN